MAEASKSDFIVLLILSNIFASSGFCFLCFSMLQIYSIILVLCKYQFCYKNNIIMLLQISKLSLPLHHQTKTKNIMNPTITNSEEFKGQVKIFLSNGHEVSFPTSQLNDFVEENELNVSTENHGTGLVCDPNGTDDYVAVKTQLDKFIDDNFDFCVEQYYLNVILKGK